MSEAMKELKGQAEEMARKAQADASAAARELAEANAVLEQATDALNAEQQAGEGLQVCSPATA